MLLRDEYESNGVGGSGGWEERVTEDCPAALRSPSVKRHWGETEDNFVRHNVREQWCLLLATWTMWKKSKSDGILCLCCEIWWTCSHLTPTTDEDDVFTYNAGLRCIEEIMNVFSAAGC